MSVLAITASALVALGGCGGTGVPLPGGGDGDSGLRRPRPAGGSYAIETIAEDDAGLHLAMASDGERVALAWFSTSPRDDGPCVEAGPDGPARSVWALWVATESAGGFQVEEVDELLALSEPTGLDIALDASGAPLIAATTGAPWARLRYCGANDAGLYRRSAAGWSLVTAVAESGEAATGNAASDYGSVVGHWPALGVRADGRIALAYRDVHSGSIQSDDQRRADLEIAWGDGTAFAAEAIDWGHGSGTRSELAFDAAGRAHVLTTNEVESGTEESRGVWLWRAAEDEAWQSVRLWGATSGSRPALAVDASDAPVIAVHDAALGQPRLFLLAEGADGVTSASAWRSEPVGDPRYDEGYDPSLAIAPDGEVWIAYRRCVRATETRGSCAPEDDAVVVAHGPLGESLTVEVVDEGEAGAECGGEPRVVIASGEVVIAYRCRVASGGTLRDSVRIARRELP